MDLSLLADAATAAPSSEASEAAFVLSELRTASAMEDESGMPSPGDTEVTENFMDLHPWTHEEDALLRSVVAAHRGTSRDGPVPTGDADATVWRLAAAALEGRSSDECLGRWGVLSVEQVKGPWSQTEDDQLSELVSRYGGKQWARIATMMPGRTGKQCRERWCNNLDPTLKKGEWTHDEDLTILRLHKKLGTRWAEIAKSLPGRSDNGVKNRWYSTCSRMLRQQVAEEEAAAEAAAALTGGGGGSGAGSSAATEVDESEMAGAEEGGAGELTPVKRAWSPSVSLTAARTNALTTATPPNKKMGERSSMRKRKAGADFGSPPARTSGRRGRSTDAAAAIADADADGASSIADAPAELVGANGA